MPFVPFSSIYVLRVLAYQMSGEVYGSTLPHVSEALSSVFRSSYAILRSILELLDRVGPGVDTDVADVVTDDFGCLRIAESTVTSTPHVSIHSAVLSPLWTKPSLTLVFLASLPLVVHSLLRLCPLVAGLNPALHANTWRFILRY